MDSLHLFFAFSSHALCGNLTLVLFTTIFTAVLFVYSCFPFNLNCVIVTNRSLKPGASNSCSWPSSGHFQTGYFHMKIHFRTLFPVKM